MTEYNGWKNYSTWNCALHMGLDPYYSAAVEFMQDYKGKRPYKDFCADTGLDTQKTPDLIQWASTKLDYRRLNEMMWEFAPEKARS